MRLLFALCFSAFAASSLAQVSFRGIGIGTGYVGSQLIGLSANGKVAAGNWSKEGAAYPVIEAFFSDEGGQRGVGFLPGSVSQSRAVGLSGDGSRMYVTAFQGTLGSGGQFVAGGIDDGGALTSFGTVSGTDGLYGRAVACHAQTLFVEASQNGGVGAGLCYRWTPGTGYVAVSAPGALDVNAVSRDATGIVGVLNGAAARYDGNAWVPVASPSDGRVSLNATTSNAAAMAGTAYSASGSSSVAVRWTNDAPTILGDLDGGGDHGSALGMTDDGSFLVGTGTEAYWEYDFMRDEYVDIGRQVGWIWSEGLGMQSIESLLGSYDLYSGWELQTATSVVLNQGLLTIGGNGIDTLGRNQGWVATVRVAAVPEPGTWAALSLGAVALLRRRRTLP